MRNASSSNLLDTHSYKEVREIRRIYNAGAATQETLAVKYGVSQRAVSLIVRNETYKDVI